jgi:hypothetical protein
VRLISSHDVIPLPLLCTGPSPLILTLTLSHARLIAMWTCVWCIFNCRYFTWLVMHYWLGAMFLCFLIIGGIRNAVWEAWCSFVGMRLCLKGQCRIPRLLLA